MASEGTDSKCEGRENPDLSEDTGVSMVDVLEEETKLEEDANAVLGDSDDKNCTYLMVSFISKTKVAIPGGKGKTERHAVIVGRPCFGLE